VIRDAPGRRTPKRSLAQTRAGPRVRRQARRLLLRASARRAARPGLRVLAYHLVPTPSVFRAHVDAIRAVAEIIDETEFLDVLARAGTVQPIECRVLLTFDDGYRQHLTNEALDLVRDLGLRPTVFMIAAGVDPTLGRPERLTRRQRGEPRPLANAEELRTAVSAGWFVGSHTSTHWDCSRGTTGDLEREIGGSKAVLEACLGTEVRTFAFPWGKPENISAEAHDVVRTSGYDAAFTTVRGAITRAPASAFALPRDVVEDWWGPPELRGCLAGALDRFGIGP
jgi:peptidoglycan/xylan/chitin deacetylase (PgdA/CDA1 family)